MTRSLFPLKSKAGYQYIDEGPDAGAPTVVLLHGMLGDVFNWKETVDGLAHHGYRVLVPLLPVYDLPIKQTSVSGLVDYVRSFFDAMGIRDAVLAGNSLGGHVAALFTLRHDQYVSALVLSGASGIEEVEMGSSTLRRRDKEYIRERAAITFFDPCHATESLVDSVYDIVNSRPRAVRLIRMARAVQNESVAELLDEVKVPTLLVWGKEDVITPPDVAHQFLQSIPDARLHTIPQCGHAPMIEHPERFVTYMLQFMHSTLPQPAMAATG